MNLNIVKDLYIFLALLLLAVAMVGVFYLLKIVTKRCGKVARCFVEVLLGIGFCMAVFGIAYWLDDGVIRIIYPLLAGVEFYLMVKSIEKIKAIIIKRRLKVLDSNSQHAIK